VDINFELILSIVGAAAWIPIITMPIINSLRKIKVNLLEFRTLTDGRAIPVGKQQEKRGTIILMVVDLFTKNTDYFPTKVSAQIKLKSGTISNSYLLDFSAVVTNYKDQTISEFNIPMELEFNVSRAICKNKDNIKCIALLVEGANFVQLHDVDEINLALYSGKFRKKKVKISEKNFPQFNSTRILEQYEKRGGLN